MRTPPLTRRILGVASLGLVLAPLLPATAAPAADAEIHATLEAIHMLENPRDLSTPGPCGELGAYQFREGTWKCYSPEPFRRALDRRASDQVAVQHYVFLRRRLETHGIEATPYTIALAWNAGIGAVVKGRAPRAARDYAERAANLASEFRRNPDGNAP
jgi:hypothetical protein